MKIILISNDNPHFLNTNHYRVAALRQRGHNVLFFNDRAFILPNRIHRFSSRFYDWDLKQLNQKLLKIARHFSPDLCLFVGGYRVTADTLQKLKSLKIKIVLWTSDAPQDFSHILNTAKYYDKIFCAGSEAITLLQQNGIKNPIWLPFACDLQYHHPANISEPNIKVNKPAVVFVGSYYPNRAEIFETIADFDLQIWGPGWRKVSAQSPLKKKIINRPVPVQEWTKIYTNAQIVLCVHFNDKKTPCNQISPRVFEALACGVFVLTDRQPDLERVFKNNEHLVIFDGPNDLKQKINFYLNNRPERDRIRHNGQKFVIEQHTYVKRLDEILRNL